MHWRMTPTHQVLPGAAYPFRFMMVVRPLTALPLRVASLPERSAALSEALAWCEERFGPESIPRRLDGARWSTHGTGILFRDERDAFEFKVRWC